MNSQAGTAGRETPGVLGAEDPDVRAAMLSISSKAKDVLALTEELEKAFLPVLVLKPLNDPEAHIPPRQTQHGMDLRSFELALFVIADRLNAMIRGCQL